MWWYELDNDEDKHNELEVFERNPVFSNDGNDGNDDQWG